MKIFNKIVIPALLAIGVVVPAVGFAQQAPSKQPVERRANGQRLPTKPVEGNAKGHLHFYVDIPEEYQMVNKKGEVVEEVNVEIHAEMTVGPKKDHHAQGN